MSLPGCSICALPPEKLDRIHAALDKLTPHGGGIRKIAKSFGVDRKALSAHKHQCRAGHKPAIHVPAEVAREGAVGTEPTREAVEAGEDSHDSPPPTELASRARAPAQAVNEAELQRDRLLEMLKLINSGKDEGVTTYDRLARRWGITVNAVAAIAAHAHAVWRTARGDMTAEGNRSIATGERVKRASLRLAKDPYADGRTKAAALGTVVKAQSQIDRVTGVALGAAMARVWQTPECQALMAAILKALARHPAVREEVLDAVRGELEAKRVGMLLDDLLGGGAIDVISNNSDGVEEP